jgi:hypothetical protein
MDIHINYDSDQIVSASNAKFDGLIIDNTLSWKGHVDWLVWPDIPVWLPANNHYGPGTAILITTFQIPGQDVWYSALADDSPPPRD